MTYNLFKPQRSPRHKPDEMPTTASNPLDGGNSQPQKVITLHPESALAKQFQAAQEKLQTNPDDIHPTGSGYTRLA